jgi:nitrogen fixation protein FixH
MSTAVQTKGTFTGRKMLLSILAFFGVIIAVNVGLTVFALRTDTGLVVPNSYVASQNFNRMRANAAAQETLGWRMNIRTSEDTVTIRVLEESGAPLPGLTFEARAGRPVSDFQDRQLVFAEVAPGIYRASTILGDGTWEIDVTALTDTKQSFRRIFRIDSKTSQ